MNEPSIFDTASKRLPENVKTIRRRYIEERYKLMPYLYTAVSLQRPQ